MALISSLATVKGQPQVILDRGLKGGEKAILDYVISDECPDDERLNPNYEDAGYQVYLLWLAVMQDLADPYIAQYRKYKTWLREQKDNPRFYWGSKWSLDMPDLQYVTSPYVSYTQSASARLIEEVRARTPSDYSLDVEPDEETHAETGTEGAETEAVPVTEVAAVGAPDHGLLTRVAEDIARMRLAPGVRRQGCKFGSVRSLENSVMLHEIRRCTDVRQAQRMLVQWFPCLTPIMNEDAHQNIIKEFVAGIRDTKLMLAALQKYESIMRDIMESQGLKKIADLYAIGLRSCKRMDLMPDDTKSVTDILNTERLCLRFMEMKYKLRRERTLLEKCMMRLEFLDREHKLLCEHGAEDDRDYNDGRQCLVDAINAYVADPDDMDLQRDAIAWMNILSFELTLGIEECLRSIGTERLRPERLIGKNW